MKWLTVAIAAFIISSPPLPPLTLTALEPSGVPPYLNGSGAMGVTQTMTEAQFIQTTFLDPHNSKITGEMVVSMRSWYGIAPLWTLTILGAETSLGDTDPKVGGRLVGANNFGCIKSGDKSTPWGRLSTGTILVGGKRWWIYPSAWVGMAAWGRLIKVGPSFSPGYYLDHLKAGDWRGFAEMYYGKNVGGFETYLANILKIEASFKAKANAAGFAW